MEKSLKYRIENDTFSSRKIIIDTDEDPQSAIDNHILNKLVHISTTEQKPKSVLEYNQEIREVLKGKTLKKINTTPDAKKAYDKLIVQIKTSQ